MNDVFPSITAVSIKDAAAGSIVKITRFNGSALAILTDQILNGVRSFVWLNIKIQGRPSVIYAENWRNEEAVLRYGGNIRFELSMLDDDVDVLHRISRETPGVIIAIGNDLFIRAAPQDDYNGTYRLVNIRTGAVFRNSPPSNVLSFLSWQLWIRDLVADRDLMLMDFRIKNNGA